MEIKDWLSINKIEGEGNQKVTLTTSQNDGEDRTAKLVVRNGNKNVLVNVRQLKKSGSFMWYYKSVKPIPQGGATTNDVLGIFTSTAPCTLIRTDIYLNTELGMGFVQEETLEMNEGTDYIILNAESNNKEGETQPIRFVQYLVIYEGVNYGVINIPQQGVTPSFSVEPNEIEFHKEGGSKTVEITSNTNWMLWYENRQNEHHHSINVGTSGTTTVTIYADEYNGVEEIVSNIRIGIPYYDQFSVPLVVRQDSLDLPDYVDVSKNRIDMMDNTTTTVKVFSNRDWTAETDAYWITITPKEGNAKQEKEITISAYSYQGDDRVGKINFYIDGELKNTIYVYQITEVETPTDIENCFYVEPVNVGDDLTIKLSCAKYSDEDIGIQYYEKGEWKTDYLTLKKNTNTGLYEYNYVFNINKRTYFKKYGNYNSPAEKAGKVFNIKGLCNIGGDIQTLRNNCYRLFDSSDIVDSSNLIFSDNTLGYEQYAYMFEGCTSLVTTPSILPATTLGRRCYLGMFSGCTSLVTAPQLPATTLEESCYSYMFSGCTSLVNAPELPANVIPEYAYQGMFKGCKSLVNAPALPATRLSTFVSSDVIGGNCYESMFEGCTSLVTAPELPATILADWCYTNMFKGCTSLVNAPALPVTTFYIEYNQYYNHTFQNTYESMFEGCTSLVNAPALPATTLGRDCYMSMFEGCTSLVTAPELPTITLGVRDYLGMFRGCTSLNNITMLATEISGNYCLYEWVDGVSPTGIFYKNPNMNDLPTGVSGIPEGWEVRDYEGDI